MEGQVKWFENICGL